MVPNSLRSKTGLASGSMPLPFLVIAPMPHGPEDDKGNEVDPKDPAVVALIEAAVREATSRLEAKNEELIGEKRKTREQMDAVLEAVGGEDGLKRLKEQREKLATDELGKLLNEGKFDEWFERRSEAMRTKHARELEAESKRANTAETERDEAVGALQGYKVNAAIDGACDEASVKPTYREAIRALLKGRIKLEKGEAGAEEMVIYAPDLATRAFGPRGKPMSPFELVDSLRETMGELFLPSNGGGAPGGGKGGGSAVPNPWKKGSDFNMTKQGEITKTDPELAKRLRAEAGV